MGTAGAPKRENHVKAQASLVCKRNSLLPLTHLGEEGRKAVRVKCRVCPTFYT